VTILSKDSRLWSHDKSNSSPSSAMHFLCAGLISLGVSYLDPKPENVSYPISTAQLHPAAHVRHRRGRPVGSWDNPAFSLHSWMQSLNRSLIKPPPNVRLAPQI
jgi:hypothetical protein